MVNKTKFFATCPKTRAEFVSRFRSDHVFRNSAKVLGFAVIGENVVFPNGAVASVKVR